MPSSARHAVVEPAAALGAAARPGEAMAGDRLPDAIDTIPEALAFWAERTPDAPALITPGGPAITYGVLHRRANAQADSLRRDGIGRGDRVVLLMPEGAELAAVLLGTMSAAIAVPVNAALREGELASVLDGLGAAAALVSAPPLAAIQQCLRHHGVSIHVVDGDAGSEPCAAPLAGAARHAAPRPDDLALVEITSGTTGRPKRVPHTHAGLLADGRGRRDLFGLTGQDRALAVAPLTLSLGVCVLIHTLAAGGAMIFPPAPDTPALWGALTEERATWMFPSAGLVEVLIRFLRDRPAEPPPPALRLVRVTAAPISDETCDELSVRLGAPVLNSYSATETGLIATALPPPSEHRRGSVGRPIREVRVVAANGGDAARGVSGDIWVQAAGYFAGYLDDVETDAAALRPGGWYRTGDLGYLDGDGFLFLTGRRSELINRGGEKIAPAEVDAALGAHPAVRAAAAFAIPDERWGEDVVAAVVLEESQRLRAWELRAWALERLSPHKAPRRIWFVPALPRTALGKVRRGELRRLWLEQCLPSADRAE